MFTFFWGVSFGQKLEWVARLLNSIFFFLDWDWWRALNSAEFDHFWGLKSETGTGGLQLTCLLGVTLILVELWASSIPCGFLAMPIPVPRVERE